MHDPVMPLSGVTLADLALRLATNAAGKARCAEEA